MFLIDQLEEQKELEGEVAVAKYVKDNNISESAMVYKLIMSKSVYKTEKEVREYLDDKYLDDDNIVENADNFTVGIISENQIDLENSVNVEIRRGVMAYAAEILPMPSLYDMNGFNFSEKGEIKSGTDLTDINLNDGMPFIIEIARVAEGEHPTYGKLKITQQHLESMENNFKSKVTGVDLAVNEDHKKNEAFGWFKDVFLSHDKQTLYGQISWNTKGAQALSEKAYRYFSPEFRFNYVHPHTGKEYGAALLGGALTNYPFLKMDAITELSEKEINKKGVTKMQTIELSEHNKVVVELNNKVNVAQAKLDVALAREIELSDKVKSLESDIEKKSKEAAHKALFDAHKINAAQLVALNEGKSMLEVIALNEPMNTKGAGTSEKTKDVVELSNDDKAIAAKLGLTDEEFQAANK
jgi:phage I-like protein